MGRLRARLATWAGALALAGCAPQAWVVLQQNPDGTTGRIVVTGPEGQVEVDRAGVAASLDTAKPQTFEVSARQVEETFAGALAAQPRLPSVFVLYFESGGVRLTPESERLLPAVLAEVAARPGADMSIVGHTDTSGTPADNEALGLERARSVRDRVRAEGLQLDRVSIESHGEGNLLVLTPDDTPEPRNRRVEIVVR